MRNNFINTILEYKDRKGFFIVSGDAGLGVFDDFQASDPDKFLNLGIAEQNMISFSAGLSMTGFKVIVYNIIPFVLYRCYEQVRNDICYQELPVVLAGIGSGITYAPQGMTHYSIEDIGLAQTLPNLHVISPSDPVEAKLAAHYAYKCEKPVYVRLAKRGEPIIHSEKQFDITKPRIVKKGSDVAIVFHGSISNEVMKAHEILTKEKIQPMLLSVPMIMPLDKDALLDTLKSFKTVIVVEEHYENCGLGNIIRRIYLGARPKWGLKTMGIPFNFIHVIKDTEHMRGYFGISSTDIVNAVKASL